MWKQIAFDSVTDGYVAIEEQLAAGCNLISAGSNSNIHSPQAFYCRTGNLDLRLRNEADITVLRGGEFFAKSTTDLGEKPPVHPGELEVLVDAEAGSQRVAHKEDAFGIRHSETAANHVVRKDVAIAIDFVADAARFAVAAQTAASDFERAQAVLQASLKVRPMTIASPTLFICVVSVGSACGNFSKAKGGTLVPTCFWSLVELWPFSGLF